MKSDRVVTLESVYLRVLTAIFDFMLVSGLSPEICLTMPGDALKAAKKPNRAQSKAAARTLATAASILDSWHRDHRYLNTEALPRSIKLLGRAPSVEALIREEDDIASPSAFARQLKSLGFIVPCGRGLYRPRRNLALLSVPDHIVLQHVARSLSTFLGTIRHNLAHRKESERMVERFAEVPDLPVSELSAFRRFSQIQSWMLLQTTNDWLESRRARRTNASKRNTVRAGLHIHAYIEEATKRPKK